MKKLLNKLESILFVSGDALDKKEICEKLDINKKEFDNAIDELEKKYSGDCGIKLLQFKDKFQFASNPEYSAEVETLLNPIKEKALTKATLETAAIIAYKQPITRLEIEKIRGVSSDYAVQVLLNNTMIEVVGRKDTVGKPLLFGTTDEFLKKFDLTNIDELPDYNELLERIKIIDEDTNNLYNTFELPDEEEIPEFLDGENVEKFESDRFNTGEKEEEIKQKLKSINETITNAKASFDTATQELTDKSIIS